MKYGFIIIILYILGVGFALWKIDTRKPVSIPEVFLRGRWACTEYASGTECFNRNAY